MFNPFKFQQFNKNESVSGGGGPKVILITEREALIEKYNECQMNIASDKCNITFFNEKAKLFKKDSPDYKTAMTRVKEIENSLYYYKIALRAIYSLIESVK